MKNYTVAEFRENLREALNAVEAGDMVVVTRHGVSFVVITASHWNDGQASALRGVTRLVTDGESHNIRPDVIPVIPARDKTPSTRIEEIDLEDTVIYPPPKIETGADAPNEAARKQASEAMFPKTAKEVKEKLPKADGDFCKHGNLRALCKYAECRRT